MHTTRGKYLISSFVVALAGAMLAAPAQAAAPAATTLTGTPPGAKAALYNDNVDVPVPPRPDVLVYKGTLTSAGLPVAGRTVILQRKYATATAWRPVGQETTDANGVASISTDVVKNAHYRIRFAGDAEYAASTSTAMAMLQVHRDFNLDYEFVGGRNYIFGNINPGFNSRTINLQKRNCPSCAWRNVQQKKTTRTGGWRFPIVGTSGVGFRVMVPSIDRNYVKSTSSSADFK